ncbi:hypothetical protein ACFO0N_15270 [Halobium salinum]|uniref:DNA primase n=1 Tax=Halobium salinum TaxID=1364940 RepID=A0ABD5PF79_9EURY|nr:hypothetical protein [Halobium salinum]
MIDTVDSDVATDTITNTPSKNTPYVRYGFPEGINKPRQAPSLRSVDAPVPEKAETASPIYLLTDEQLDRHQSFTNPYAVANASCIATALQNECEQADRVVYPIHVESDAFPDIPFERTIQHIAEFVETELECMVGDCTFYYSGNRSIHAHIPRVVTTERTRERLKERAARFSEEVGSEFDLGIYSRKRQFRLPGVLHPKTGFPKVEVEPEWEHDRIIQEATNSTPKRPATYAEVLLSVFGPPRRQNAESVPSIGPNAPALLQKLGGDLAVLSFGNTQWVIDCPLIEQEQHPTNPTDVPRWAQYNYHEFSPYAHSSGNGRSVAVVKVKGGAFARRGKRNAATMVPAYFYGARGCNGGEFTKADEHAPLQLSDRDFEKWEFHNGDPVVIIGGQSRSSRIFTVESWQATVAGHALTGKEGSRQAALDYLVDEGYDVGRGGASETTSASETTRSKKRRDNIPPIRTPRSKAAKLQQQAEQEGIETLTHMEKWRVACRLLLYGWNPAWEWFQSQFGAEFSPELTREQFQSVIGSFPADYDHVEIPANL